VENLKNAHFGLKSLAVVEEWSREDGNLIDSLSFSVLSFPLISFSVLRGWSSGGGRSQNCTVLLSSFCLLLIPPGLDVVAVAVDRERRAVEEGMPTSLTAAAAAAAAVVVAAAAAAAVLEVVEGLVLSASPFALVLATSWDCCESALLLRLVCGTP
jgi:hypothetical protein